MEENTFSGERPDGGRGPSTAGGISGRGSAAQPLTGRPPPPPLQDGSQAAARGKKALRLFVSSLPWRTLGKRKPTQTVLVLDTQAHRSGEAGRLHPHVRVGACVHVWACVRACVCTCGHVCAPVHALHMHTIASKETASLETGRLFEFQLALSTMSV